jgi:NTE family protein
VSVEEDLLTKEEINSISDILAQINNFRSAEDLEDKIQLTDLFIEPDVEDFSIISFNKGAKIIKSGEVSVTPFLSQLKAIAKTQDYRKARKKNHRSRFFKIQ